MGFSTNITISNDLWHKIAEDPEALVKGITVAMNYGTNSPLADAHDHRDSLQHDDPEKADRACRARWERNYRMTPQGVIVHKAQHDDVPQVIVSTYGDHAIAAHELPHAIREGWLDIGPYQRKHAEEVARELSDLAARIRKSLKEADKP